MSHWWRAHDEAVDDPKLGLLSDRLHRAWFNLMCLSSANGGKLPAIGVVAFKLRVSEHKAAEIITTLCAAGLVDKLEQGFAPHNWDKRQFKSDVTDGTNAVRQKRYRDRHRVTDETVTETVTPAVTVTPTRVQSTEADTEPSLRSGVPRKRGEPLKVDWIPSEQGRAFARSKGCSEAKIDSEAQRFRDNSLSKGVLHKDVEAAWRNWITSPYARGSPNGAPRPGSREDTRERTHDAYQKLTDYVDAHADEQGGSGRDGEANAGFLPLPQPSRS